MTRTALLLLALYVLAVIAVFKLTGCESVTEAVDAYEMAIGKSLIVVWLNHRTVVITPPHTVCVPVWGAKTCNVHVIGENQ